MTSEGDLPSQSRPRRGLSPCGAGDGKGEGLKPLRGRRRRPRRVLSEWVLVRTKPRQERLAKKHIERQGYETFLPDYRQEGKFRERIDILFPGYIFMRSHTGQWRFLEGTMGVIDVVMMGGDPSWVPIKIIRELRRICDADGTLIVDEEKYNSGQAVKIKKGSFQGLLGVYIGRAADRIDILFQILGKEVRSSFPKAALTGSLSDTEKASIAEWFPQSGNRR